MGVVPSICRELRSGIRGGMAEGVAGVNRVMTKVLAGMCGECHLLPGVDLG